MKKQFLLLASAALILASCGGENKTEDKGQTQAQIDSAVNAQVAAHEAEMARQADSTMKAVEAEKAAHEAAAAEANKKAGGKHTTHKAAEPAPPPPPPPPPPPSGLKGRSDQTQANPNGTQAPSSGGGLKKRSDQNQK